MRSIYFPQRQVPFRGCSLLWLGICLHFLVQNYSVLASPAMSTSSLYFPEEYRADQPVLLCSSFGFRSALSQGIMSNLLGESKSTLLGSAPGRKQTRVIEGSSVSVPIVVDSQDRYSRIIRTKNDLSIVYIHHTEVTNNEPELLLRLQNALRSISDENSFEAEERKRALVVVLSQKEVKDMKQTVPSQDLESRVSALLNEAWALYTDKIAPEKTEGEAAFSVYIVTVPFVGGEAKVEDEALARVRDILQGFTNDVSSVRNVEVVSSLISEKASADLPNNSNSVSSGQGIDMCLEAAEVGVEWARQAANGSIQKLQKAESAKSFSVFVENLVAGALEVLEAQVRGSSGPRPAFSPAALEAGKVEARRSIFLMMLPFLKRFVQLARQDITKEFNTMVTEDLEITVKLLEDLVDAKRKCVAVLEKAVAKLIPKSAPATWAAAADLDLQIFQSSIDEYIENRVTQARLLGVLSRGRKPIEVSVHFLATHPFGRDHRQDPLGMNGRHKLVYSRELAQERDRVVSEAAALLRKNKKSLAGHGLSGADISGICLNPSVASAIATNPRDKEFAREMLMFPLSVKNPSVPLMGGRAKRRTAPPKIDKERDKTGPERYIMWGLSPLDSVQKGTELEKQTAADKNSKESPLAVLDQAVNVFPYFGSGYYKHPSYDYGSKYDPEPA